MIHLFFSLIVFAFSYNVHASDSFIEWHSTNAQLLRGADYKVGSEERTILTLEHANRWKYGDLFIFSDYMWSDGAGSTYYIEPTLRFSLSRMLDKKVSYGLIKDVLFATQIEKPKGQDTRKLYGMAFDLALPGFTFFKTNFFVRDNPSLQGDAYQITLVWKRPFEVNGIRFLSEGFADLAGSEGTASAYQLVVPRFLVDIGDIGNFEQDKLWAGVEWQYWRNKFGIDGVTESVVQLQLKYNF